MMSTPSSSQLKSYPIGESTFKKQHGPIICARMHHCKEYDFAFCLAMNLVQRWKRARAFNKPETDNFLDDWSGPRGHDP